MTEKVTLTVTVTDDPLLLSETGEILRFAPTVYNGSDAQTRASFVRNWGEFSGALLAVGFKSAAGFRIIGSAFIVAPGLALSATHIFADRFGTMGKGEEIPYAFGIDQQDLRLWLITSITTTEADELLC